MQTLAVFYFSGTGNTRYIAQLLCEKLAPRYVAEMHDVSGEGDLTDAIKTCDLALVAFPIYGSAPPIPMRKFIHRYAGLWREKRVAIAETQYFFSGDGAATIGRTLKKYGAVIVGAEHFNMPNNLADCKAFPIKNGGELKKVLARAEKRADAFARRILLGKKKKRGFSLPSHAVGYLCQRKFWWKCEAQKRTKLKVDAARCVGCGKCVKQCPVQNLVKKDGKAAPLGGCVLCYRCVNLCPMKAITLVGSEPPREQYKGIPKQ